MIKKTIQSQQIQIVISTRDNKLNMSKSAEKIQEIKIMKRKKELINSNLSFLVLKMQRKNT
jgi:hypothetical protein